MIKSLFKGALSGIGVMLLANYRHLSLQVLRIEAAKSYLRGVQMARSSALGLMRMGFVIGLICVGVVLCHGGLFFLLPFTVKVKAAIGMFLGLAYMVIGGLALRAAMDERAWMEKSGAAEMLRDATRRSSFD